MSLRQKPGEYNFPVLNNHLYVTLEMFKDWWMCKQTKNLYILHFTINQFGSKHRYFLSIRLTYQDTKFGVFV